MVEPYMGDMRFARCNLLAKLSPVALDWPSFPREWRIPDFLLLARLRQRCFLWLAIRSGTLQRVCLSSWNSSTCSSSNEQRKKQAAAASSSCKTSPWDMAHTDMAPCQRLTTTDLASCSLLVPCVSATTTIRPAAQSKLHGNDQGSTVTRRCSGEGQERGGVLCTDPASAAAAAAASTAATSKRNALLQASTACCTKQALLAAAWCCCCTRESSPLLGDDRYASGVTLVRDAPGGTSAFCTPGIV